MNHINLFETFSKRYPELTDAIEDIFLEFEDIGFKIRKIDDIKIVEAVKTTSLVRGINFVYSDPRSYGSAVPGDGVVGTIVEASITISSYVKEIEDNIIKKYVYTDDDPLDESLIKFMSRKYDLIKRRTPDGIELIGMKFVNSTPYSMRPDLLKPRLTTF